MRNFVFALLLCASQACDLARYGRISVGVEGLSSKCCSSLGPALNRDIAVQASALETHISPTPQQTQERMMGTMNALVTSCCGSDDLEVLSTLAPHEPPQAATQLKMMCSAGPGAFGGPGGPPPHDVLNLLGVGPMFTNAQLLGATSETAPLSNVWISIFRGLFGFRGYLEPRSLKTRVSSEHPATMETLRVDVSQPDETQGQVLFKRGFVNSLQGEASHHQLVNMRHEARLGISVTNLIFDLNKEEHKDVFTWSHGQLSFRSSDMIVDRITKIRTILPVEQVPELLVQLSGTPFYATVDDTYILGTGNVNNYYPLPAPTCVSSVQQAIADLIVDVTQRLGHERIFWIGTQEPTHTTGFAREDLPEKESADPSVAKKAGKKCRKLNVSRFIEYWRGIVLKTRAAFPGARFGAMQLNSHDADIYMYAAHEMVRLGCQIDLFTVQRYSSERRIQENLHKVYDFFQSSPGFEHVRVAYDRYSFDNDPSVEGRTYWLTTAGMSSFLRDESQIMDHAEIMHSWSYQINALDWSHGGKTSLLPQLVGWLQKAPKFKRGVSFSPSAGGLGAFALAARSAGRASVALWNLGDTRREVEVILQGGGDVFKGVPHLLKGASDAIEAAVGQTKKQKQDVAISDRGAGFALEPNDFVLISM